MKLYKILNAGRISPYQHRQYKTGELLTCTDFDMDSHHDCSRGFYATDLDGLCYAYRPGKHIYECEVSGDRVEIDQFKRRYEKFELGARISKSEIICRIRERRWEWDVEHATFPVNPFARKRMTVTQHEQALCREWASVGDSVRASVGASVGASVWDSVRYSVWDSVWDSVRYSVWDSVWDSVRDSVGAYMSSLFFNIKTWKHIDHNPGVNPFQPAVDLWHSGLVSMFDGSGWRLHNCDRSWEVSE